LVLCGSLLIGIPAAASDVVYVRSDGTYWHIWRSDVENGESTVINNQPFDKRLLCADSRRGHIYFRDTQGRLYRTTRDGETSSEVALPGLDVVKDCAVHPKFGFLVSTYAPNAKDNLRIWKYDLDGANVRLLISSSHLNEKPQWMPKGSGFLFVHSKPNMSTLMRSSIADPEPRALFTNSLVHVSAAVPSPDGTRIAYARRIGDQTDLWIASIDAADPRPLYEGPGFDGEPCWSGDGEWICLSTWDRNHFRIARIRPDGKDMTYLTDDGVDCREPLFLD
jgi:hypothetical protein